MVFIQEQRNTLSILGYLYYRMGRLSNTTTVFMALGKLASEGMDVISRKAVATLTVIETDRDNAERALQLLHWVTSGQTLSIRRAALHLLRARALWQRGCKDEARAAVNEYLYLVSNSPSAQALAEPPSNNMGKHA